MGSCSTLAVTNDQGLGRVVTTADVFIESLLKHPQATLWIEPSKGSPDQHTVSLEGNNRIIAEMTLDSNLGDAILARFAIVCGLDLLARGAQSGNLVVCHDGGSTELSATIRIGRDHLRGEVRLADISSLVSVDIDAESLWPQLPDVLQAETQVGQYKIDKLIGRGGMGLVYKVEHTLLRKPYAMKVLRQNYLRLNASGAIHFLREARAAARIHSPRIVNVTDFGSLSDGSPYLIMELITGGSLYELLKHGALPVERVIALAKGIAEALEIAHAHGVVHGDLTPTNIFIDEVDGREMVKLVDFGAAHSIDDNGNDYRCKGKTLGTPHYMAPEQIQQTKADQRIDIYALGIVLFEALADLVPFDGDMRTIFDRHVNEPAPALHAYVYDIPEELDQLVARCLKKNPEERYQSISDVLTDLRRIDSVIQRGGWKRWLPA